MNDQFKALKASLQAQREALLAEIDANEQKLVALDDAIALVEDAADTLTSTMPVDDALRADELLATRTVASHRWPWKEQYELNAWFVRDSDGFAHYVYTCSCPAFRFTKGNMRAGERVPCKHLREALDSGFGDEAYNVKVKKHG